MRIFCSYDREICKAALLWRKIFGDNALLLNKMKEIFENNFKELILFLAIKSTKSDVNTRKELQTNNHVDAFGLA